MVASSLGGRIGTLYREEFATFEDYCRDRLKCSRSLGYRLIAHAAMVIEMGVSPIGDKLGTGSQARELARVPREMRKEVLRLADEMADDGPISINLRIDLAQRSRYRCRHANSKCC